MTKTPTTYCYVTDYLGSVRTTYRITGESESVPVQHISYMPSGAVIKDSQPSLQKRRFTGKELITMHGWNMYDSGARFQYRAMPRFSSMDPLCEKYYNTSPYAYCVNNPVRFIDPDGRSHDEYYYDGNGKQLDFVKNDTPDTFFVKDDNGDIKHESNYSAPYGMSGYPTVVQQQVLH